MEGNLCIFSDDQLSPNVMFGYEGYVPEDILVEVFLRLPVRRLVCFRCVCKSWCALIDDVNFIKRHYELQYAKCKADGDIPLMCRGLVYDLANPYSRNFDIYVCLLTEQNGDVPLDLTPDLVRDSADSFVNDSNKFNDATLIVGVVEGVVCLFWGLQDDLGLWNPATREFKAVTPWLNRPIQRSQLNFIGFGFDCITNDFKIVRGNRSDDGTLSHEVYSLTKNYWKRLREPSPLVHAGRRSSPDAYVNGVCYWAVFPATSFTPLILSFDFRTEVFKVFNRPKNEIGYEIDRYEYHWTTTVYKECLAFFATRTDEDRLEDSLEVWVVTEFDESGVPKTLKLSLTMGPFNSFDDRNFTKFRNDDDVLFTSCSRIVGIECSLYNLSTRTFKDLGFPLDMTSNYVESLFPLLRRLVWSSGVEHSTGVNAHNN